MKHFCGQECSYINPDNNCNGCKYYDEFLQKVREHSISNRATIGKVEWNFEIEDCVISDFTGTNKREHSSLKITDVMVGDFVYCGDNPVRIIGITHDQFGRYRISYAIGGLSISEPIERYKPIPLMPEILEKNGFVQTTGLEYAIGTTNDLEPLYYAQGKLLIDIGARCRSVCRICYVHQLQHALRLCGIEKEIVV